MYLFYDTETTGLPNHKLSLTDPSQARIIQLAAILMDESFEEIACMSSLVQPSGWNIHPMAEQAHGISKEKCEKFGAPAKDVMRMFIHMYSKAKTLIAHNHKFDEHFVNVELAVNGFTYPIAMPSFCTMLSTTNLCRLPGRIPGQFKWPKLVELHKFLFDTEFEGAHDALADVRATARCFRYLVENKLIETSVALR